MKYILESKIRCPKCGFEKLETMPTNACQFFYTCISCNEILKPKKGDCCIFCSYGTIKCPPKQKELENEAVDFSTLVNQHPDIKDFVEDSLRIFSKALDGFIKRKCV